MPGITIIKGVDEYNPGLELVVEGVPFSIRGQEEKLAYAHGSREVGDGKVEPRTITIKGMTRMYSDKEDHDQYLFELAEKFGQREYQLFYGGIGSRYINIERLVDFRIKHIELFGGRMSELTITLRATDPFWYSDEESLDETDVTENPQDWEIENGGNIEVCPVITITAPNPGVVDSILFKNNNTEYQWLYEDNAMRDGAVLTVDAVNGTVARDGTNTIRYFDGCFWPLIPGVNEVYIEAANCSVDTTWRERWL